MERQIIRGVYSVGSESFRFGPAPTGFIPVERQIIRYLVPRIARTVYSLNVPT